MIRLATSALRVSAFVAIAATLSACSSSAPSQQTGSALAPAQPASSGTAAYELTEREQKLGCKELTGAMRVRILQVRSMSTQTNGTMAARGLQYGATSVWGGPSHGISPEADQARDIAQLEAYNRQLAVKKCPTLDLQAELNAPAKAATPAPAPRAL